MAKCTRSTGFSFRWRYRSHSETIVTYRQVSGRTFFLMVKSVYCSVSFHKGNEGIENCSRTRISSKDFFSAFLSEFYSYFSKRSLLLLIFFFTCSQSPRAKTHSRPLKRVAMMASGFDNADDAVCPPQRLKLVSATPQDASTENQGNSTCSLLTRWNTSERCVCTRSMKDTSSEYNRKSISQTLVLLEFHISWTKHVCRWVLLLCNFNPDFPNLRTSRSNFFFPRRLEETVFYRTIKTESSFFQALKCYQTIVSPVLERGMVKVSCSFYLTLSLLAFMTFTYRAAEMVTWTTDRTI